MDKKRLIAWLENMNEKLDMLIEMQQNLIDKLAQKNAESKRARELRNFTIDNKTYYLKDYQMSQMKKR
jgi:hypothetical protein